MVRKGLANLGLFDAAVVGFGKEVPEVDFKSTSHALCNDKCSVYSMRMQPPCRKLTIDNLLSTG